MREYHRSGAKHYLLALVVCWSLMSCDLKEQNKKDFAAIKNWEGQDIQVAIDALGPPDGVTTGPKGHAYYWYRSREVGKTVVGNSWPADNTTNSSPHAPFVTQTASCRLRITTTPDNIIQHYRYKGMTLGCQVLAKEIGAATESSSDDDDSIEDSK